MRKWVIIRLLALVVAFLSMVGMLTYAVFSVAGVRQKMKLLNEQSDAQLLNFDPLLVDSAYMELFREKNWLETRLILSKSDSIYLSVHLKDSLLQLEMKGVVLTQIKLIDFEYDRFFDVLSPGTYHHLFATQTQVDSTFSTIGKGPVTIKKITNINAQILSESPDTIKIMEAVHWISWLDNGVRINIEGIGTDFPDRNWHRELFWISQDLKKIARTIKQASALKLPDYYPEITLVLTDRDAKTIFRALPEKPFVAFRF
ncbi:hypothetical protein [uncultured Sunxiuqinia sp.]|uniref:hypothetical protein n=1 Tax=uncultured Sunxiuqinia sp. TaxID=1573825 RepID=UPI0030DD1687|tara:strand:- start:83107 stop:83880 length:774 start_codon:yes stop_codon:yes gene_type:complete